MQKLKNFEVTPSSTLITSILLLLYQTLHNLKNTVIGPSRSKVHNSLRQIYQKEVVSVLKRITWGKSKKDVKVKTTVGEKVEKMELTKERIKYMQVG